MPSSVSHIHFSSVPLDTKPSHRKEIIKAENIPFTLQRAQATSAVKVSFAGAWVSEVKTVVQRNAAIAALVAKMEAAQDAEADCLAKRGEAYAAIDALHSLAGRCLRMAKNRYRSDPAKLEVIATLRNDAGSHAGHLQDALEWESAWEKLDAAWSPLPGVTLATFKPQRLAALALLEAVTTKENRVGYRGRRIGCHGPCLEL